MPRAFATALACLVLITVPATADVIRVDQAGGGDYTTIGEGVAAADEGDTVLVAPGTYTGAMNRAVAIGNGVTLMSDGGPEVTTVDCEGQDYAFQGYAVIIEGFTIRRSVGNPDGVIVAVSLIHSTISNCVFEDNSEDGLRVYGTNTISDCSFLNHGGTAAVIDPGGASTISDCVFEGNAGGGLDVWNEWYGDSHPPHHISRCVFRGNSTYGLKMLVEDPLVEECIFEDNSGPAIWADYSLGEVADCTIVRNHSAAHGALHFTLTHHSASNHCAISSSIIAFNSCLGVISGQPDHSDCFENCSFGNAGGDSLVCGGSCYGNVSEDPLFCGLAGGDYTLCANSPCLPDNDPIGWGAGAFQDAPGCPPCDSPVEPVSWGTMKGLFR